MITVQETEAILRKHKLEFWFGPGPMDSNPRTATTTVWLGKRPDTYLIYFYPPNRIMYIGDSVIGHSLNWNIWFSLFESEISLRGIKVAWWHEHRNALLELVQLIESKFSSPVNCYPDICPQ